ncbi:MAG: Alpha/Beta hydrolase protein, partial [Linnemannia gamsii]
MSTSHFFSFPIPLHSSFMTSSFLTFNRVAVRHIPFATGCRYYSNGAAGTRWPYMLLEQLQRRLPGSGSGSGLRTGLPAASISLVSQSQGQKRYESNKKATPSQSPDSFGRQGAALRRRQQEEKEQTDDERSSHVSKQAQGMKEDRRPASDREKKDDKNAKEDPRKEAIEEKQELKTFRAARLPIVLCHGFSGFDSLGTNPDFRFDYWYGVREALDEIGANVHAARVPPFAGIQHRAKALRDYIERTVPHGSELNLIGHSMGGLDCRYLISHLQSPHFKVRSLTTLGTPHRGSPFADYVMSDIVGSARLEAFWTLLGLVGIERGAAENLTTHYLNNEFNPNTPNQPGVSYFSYAASFQPGFFSRFRFPWQVIMDREGDNDGLVSVKSAQWGTYIRTIPNADHMDLMNWVNALAWSRARFPWILGGS